MRTWATAHRRALAGALRRLAAAPLASLLNVAVIGIALALPMALYVMLDNARNLARDYAPQPELSLFLSADAGATDIQVIELRLKKHASLAGYRFVPKAQALEQLKSRAGLGDVAAGLPQNPLPDAFVVTARDSGSAALEALRAEFAAWPKVAEAHVDSDWARRLDNLIALGHRAVVMLADHEPTGAVGENVIAYLNRLSDLFFILARGANKAAGTPDVLWVPGAGTGTGS